MTEWLNALVGEAIAPYATIAIALVVVFLLIALLFRVLKAFSTGKFGTMHQNRLGIIEAMALEGKRRVVLIRRDNVEHLVLIGGENDVVIEHGIKRESSQSLQVTKTQQPTMIAKPPMTPTKATQQPSAHPAPQNTQPQTPQNAKLQAPQSAQPQAPQSAHQQASGKIPTPTQAPTTIQPAITTAKPTHSATATNDSAKIKEMDRLLDQIAGD